MKEVNQANLYVGWEPNQNPPPVVQFNTNGWNAWPNQEGELAADELAAVQNLAEQVVINAMAQHPDQAQDSASISSSTREFFRAQGAPVTLELPLPTEEQAIVLSQNICNNVDTDYKIRLLASSLERHDVVGPQSSIQMRIADIHEFALVTKNETAHQGSYGAAQLEP